jgi:hypothetical protein
MATSYWRVSVQTILSNLARTLTALFLVAIATLLSSCGGSGAPKTATTTTTVSPAVAVSLTSTASSVKSDGSNTVTITATALTSGNAVVSGQVLNFSASTGQLGASTGTTDSTGKVSVTFSGTSGINGSAIITATLAGTAVSGSIPIQISGSTVSLTGATSGASGAPIAISVTTNNAGGIPVASQPLRYSIAASSTGSGTLSAATGNSGTGTTSVSVTGTAGGTVNVLVEWLDSAGNVTASATKPITISGTTAGTFGVTAPTNCPCAVAIGTPLSITLNVPTTGIANVRFATTLGSWPNGLKVDTVPNPGTGTLTLALATGTSAGNATIQIDALDSTGAALSTASFIVSISAPSTTATSITLQSNVAVMPPSIGSSLSTATLTAVVKDVNNNPVGGANVFFELVNSTGTGESISPVVATTNSTGSLLGQVQATFTAGTSTTQNSYVKATVVGTTISAQTPITVGGTAASVSIGLSTVVAVVNNNTAYSLPVSVLVSDSNGSLVSGAVVSLSLWPSYYYKGERNALCQALRFGKFANEDTNENLILDPGEDTDGPGGYVLGSLAAATIGPSPSVGAPTMCLGVATQHDCALWAAPSTAGTIPLTVTTGADGTATFNWVYLKQYANWINARIRASIQVQGTQTTSVLYSDLLPAVTDVVSPCTLPNSPFN